MVYRRSGNAVTRRGLVRSAAGCAGLCAMQGLLLPAARAASPAPQHGVIQLVVSVAYQGSTTFQGTMQEIVDRYIEANWTSRHPGVRVTTISGMGCNGTCLSGSAEIANSLAGNPADVITGCCGQWYEYLNAGMLRPLDPFIKMDNLDISIFSPGHLAALTTDQGILAFPEYDGPMVLAVDLGMLDELGLPYPSDDWTYEDAAKLWRAIAGVRNGKKVTGAQLDVPDDWVAKAWGGSKGDPSGTVCTLDSPQVIAAYEFWVPLAAGGIIDGPDNHIRHGTTGMRMQGGWDIQSDLFKYNGLKWRYYEMPFFPAGRSTFINNDFYAINQYSKNPPDLVWDIFKFLTIDRGFQLLQWKTTFVTPNQVHLWPDWLEVIYQVAPGLQGKNLEAFAHAVEYGVGQYFFKYDDPAAENIINNYYTKMFAQQISVPLALQEAARQVNALEKAAAATWTEAAASVAQARAEIAGAERGAIQVFAPPPTAGVGAPPTAAGAAVQVRAGQYVLFGDGSDVWGGSDNCVFAGSSETATSGVYTCRLVSLSNVDCPHLSQWAKVGLMARGDLSDDASYVAVMVTGENGVVVQYRPLPTVNTLGVGASGPGQTNLTLPNTSPHPNYLKQPVWLRLTRRINTWQAYTSLDGKKWTPAGGPVVIPVAGAWVGLFATSHNSSGGFQPGQKIKAVFDNVSGFTPSRLVQIGQP
jgi:ABC-type glycerol-3-phosphate transport system substrate-binding protein